MCANSFTIFGSILQYVLSTRLVKFIFSSIFYYKVAIELSEPLGEKSDLNIEFVSA